MYMHKLNKVDNSPAITTNHVFFVTYHKLCNMNKTICATSETGSVYPSGVPEFSPSFIGVDVAQSVVFWLVFCRSLFLPFIHFLLVFVLPVVRRVTASDDSFGICNLPLHFIKLKTL